MDDGVEAAPTGAVLRGGFGGAGGPAAAAFRTTRMPMVITDARGDDNPIACVNDAFLGLTGYDRGEVVGRNCRFMQGPGTDRRTVGRIREAVRGGRDLAVEILNYRKDGSAFWNALYVSPVRDDRGELTHFFSSQLDVTEKKELELRLQEAKASLEDEVERRTRDLQDALRAKEILLHEVDHRVKNNLQLVASLVSMQARRISDPELRASLLRMLERVTALSMVHQRLYQSSDMGAFDLGGFARQLAEDLLAASGREDVRLELDLEPLDLPAVKGAPLALALNELLVNALRHAFPEGRSGGVLALTLRRRDGACEVVVEDDGVGVGAGAAGGRSAGAGVVPPPGGFGVTLVRSLARQLQADLAWERRPSPGGTRARLRLPLNGGRENRQGGHAG